MYHDYKGTIFCTVWRCGPGRLGTSIKHLPGELVKIMDIETPYDDESCWEGVQELSQEARDKLTEVFLNHSKRYRIFRNHLKLYRITQHNERYF